MTYMIPEVSREEVIKKLERIAKKAATYGGKLDYNCGEPYYYEIAVYDHDGHTREKIGTQAYEVFDLTVEGEIIKKDGYTVAAKIEHLDGGNVVTVFDGAMNPEWAKMKPYCEHCHGDHGQRVTFIVRGTNGETKQVGRTCLKDYCGINPQAVGVAYEINCLMEGEDAFGFDWDAANVHPACYTEDVLALAVMLQRTKGYTRSDEPNSNKDMLLSLSRNNDKADQQDYVKVEEMQRVIRAMSKDDAIDANLNNVKTLIECGYCKHSHFGYLAYAPLAYERYLKKLASAAEREAAKEIERSASQYVGEIGKRIVIEVAEMRLLSSWESYWGYTYLYKFVDTKGNVMVWFASKPFERVNENGAFEDVINPSKIKATVKAFNERDGVKQTILTRVCEA